MRLTIPAALVSGPDRLFSLTPKQQLKLRQSALWPETKITNGNVDMKLYDYNGKVAQTLFFSANWWDGACDGTGAYLIALAFGDTVTDISEWTHSPKPPNPTVIMVMGQ